MALKTKNDPLELTHDQRREFVERLLKNLKTELSEMEAGFISNETYEETQRAIAAIDPHLEPLLRELDLARREPLQRIVRHLSARFEN